MQLQRRTAPPRKSDVPREFRTSLLTSEQQNLDVLLRLEHF